MADEKQIISIKQVGQFWMPIDNTQYNLPEICKNLGYKTNRKLVEDRFADPSAQKSVTLDVQLISCKACRITGTCEKRL